MSDAWYIIHKYSYKTSNIDKKYSSDSSVYD